jgi:hypothetical protein
MSKILKFFFPLRAAIPFIVLMLLLLGYFWLWPIQALKGGEELSILNTLQEKALSTFLEAVKLTGAVATLGLGAVGVVVSKAKDFGKPTVLAQILLSAALLAFGLSLFAAFYEYRLAAEMLANSFFTLGDPSFERLEGMSIYPLFLGAALLVIGIAAFERRQR